MFRGLGGACCLCGGVRGDDVSRAELAGGRRSYYWSWIGSDIGGHGGGFRQVGWKLKFVQELTFFAVDMWSQVFLG